MYMQPAKNIASQRICVGSPEPSMLADAISFKSLCTGSSVNQLERLHYNFRAIRAFAPYICF